MAMKFDGVVGIGIQSAQGTGVAASFYPVCEDANINSEPVHHERVSSAGKRLKPRPAGFNHSFDLSGVEGDNTHLGLLLYAMLGSGTYATGTNTFTYGVSKYLTTLVDRNVDLGSSNEAERLIDVRGESLEFEVNPRSISRLSFRGPGTEKDAQSGLTASLPTGSPLTWDMLLTSNSGYFKSQVNDAALSADQEVRSFKFGISRTQKNDKLTAEGLQPQDILQGNGEITFEFGKTFDNSTDYTAFTSQYEVGVEALFYVSATESLKVTIPHGTFEAPNLDGVGSGEDEILWNCQAKAFFDGTDEIITVVVETDSVDLT